MSNKINMRPDTRTAKQRDEEKQREKKERQQRLRVRIACIAFPVLTACAIGGLVWYANKEKTKDVAESTEAEKPQETPKGFDYSEQLNDDGLIKGVDVNDYVADFDPSTIVLDEYYVTYTDEELESDLQYLLEKNEKLDEDETRIVKEGDTISVDFDAYIDGSLESDTSSKGARVNLGGGILPEEVEKKIAGHHVGQTFKVATVYPDDYPEEANRGKEAVYRIHINGVYEIPELTDEFVQEIYPEFKSVEELKEYARKETKRGMYESEIDHWIGENVTLEKYPEKYLAHITAAVDEYYRFTYEDLKAEYSSAGTPLTESYDEYYATEDQTYEGRIDSEAKHDVAVDLICQKIYEDYLEPVTDEEFTAYIEEAGFSEMQQETMGLPYIKKSLIHSKVLEYLMETVQVKNMDKLEYEPITNEEPEVLEVTETDPELGVKMQENAEVKAEEAAEEEIDAEEVDSKESETKEMDEPEIADDVETIEDIETDDTDAKAEDVKTAADEIKEKAEKAVKTEEIEKEGEKDVDD